MSNQQLIVFFTRKNRIDACYVLAGRSGLLLSSQAEALSRRLPQWGG